MNVKGVQLQDLQLKFKLQEQMPIRQMLFPTISGQCLVEDRLCYTLTPTVPVLDEDVEAAPTLEASILEEVNRKWDPSNKEAFNNHRSGLVSLVLALVTDFLAEDLSSVLADSTTVLPVFAFTLRGKEFRILQTFFRGQQP